MREPKGVQKCQEETEQDQKDAARTRVVDWALAARDRPSAPSPRRISHPLTHNPEVGDADRAWAAAEAAEAVVAEEAETGTTERPNTGVLETHTQRRLIMPAGDGSGPAGMGPMTGRAAGFCAGYDRPGYANPAGGRGFWGRGRGGGGRGWRNGFFATGLPGWARWGAAPGAPVAAPTEKDALESQAGALRDQLDRIEQRLKSLSETEDKG